MEKPIRLTSPDAAKALGIAPYTLRQWRMEGKGPPYSKGAGRQGRVYYRVADLEAWEDANPKYRNTLEVTMAEGKTR